MAITTSNIPVNIPRGKIESTGSMTVFLKCDTASSGEGLFSGVMPLYSPSYELPTEQINLFLEAQNQVGIWGHNLHSVWPGYTLESWSSWPSGSKPASGFVYSNLNMAVSGQRVKNSYAVMPMFVRTNATGNSSATMSLVTINQEVSTGEMSMFSKGHDLAYSTTTLFTKSSGAGSSGTLDLVATGIGFSYGSISLTTRGLP